MTVHVVNFLKVNYCNFVKINCYFLLISLICLLVTEIVFEQTAGTSQSACKDLGTFLYFLLYFYFIFFVNFCYQTRLAAVWLLGMHRAFIALYYHVKICDVHSSI